VYAYRPSVGFSRLGRDKAEHKEFSA
jgi:hypothetical protein